MDVIATAENKTFQRMWCDFKRPRLSGEACLNSHVTVVACSSASLACSHSWPEWSRVRGCGLFTAWLPDRRVSESAWTTDRSFCQTRFDLFELCEVLGEQVDVEGADVATEVEFPVLTAEAFLTIFLLLICIILRLGVQAELPDYIHQLVSCILEYSDCF